MSDDPTVLGMINRNLTSLNLKVDGLVKDKGQTDVKIENHEGRLNTVESSEKINHEVFIKHIENKNKHFNPYYSESYGEKIRRKSPEIITGVSVSTIISGIVIAILKSQGLI